MFHLTHRCHNRAFLLKFARDRNAYRAKLREHLLQHQLWLLDYCLTCNHVHLLVDAPERSQMSAWMQRVAGEFARAYNRRKVQKNLEASLGEALARAQARREPCWTESLVVGSAPFVRRMQPLMLSRQETEIMEGQDGVCVLREAKTAYGKETGPKSAP